MEGGGERAFNGGWGPGYRSVGSDSGDGRHDGGGPGGIGGGLDIGDSFRGRLGSSVGGMNNGRVQGGRGGRLDHVGDGLGGG